MISTWLLEAKLWKRIAKDPRVLDNIIARMGNFKNTEHLTKEFGKKMKGATKITGQHNKKIIRRILSSKHDAVNDMSMSNPIKRASYFRVKHKNKPDIVGRLVFSPGIVGGPGADVIKIAAKDASKVASNALRKSRNNGNGIFPAFKVFNKESINISRATGLTRKQELKGAHAGTLTTPSTIFHNMHGNTLQQQPSLFAMPGHGGKNIKSSYSDMYKRVVRYKIPANKVIFGNNTVGVAMHMPEVVIPRQNWKHIK